jgi:hypothetical protein
LLFEPVELLGWLAALTPRSSASAVMEVSSV